MNSTWHEEPEKRLSFTDIVHYLCNQSIDDTSADEAENTTSNSKNVSNYLNLSTSQQ